MVYRVETASSGRAGCRATECKNAGIKIEKDELRLGTWVPFEDRGAWHWRHWGCVTGKQIENLRNQLEDPDRVGSGVYRWDFLDGYDGEEKNSLEKHPDLQEKVRRVITQGFIDPEDFNGDPDMNKLGETGLRTKKTKKRMREENKARTAQLKELEAKERGEAERIQQGRCGTKEEEEINTQVRDVKQKPNSQINKDKKPAGKKRSRAKKETNDEDEEPYEEDEDDEDDEKPVKKRRARKTKVEDEEREEDGNIKPAPVKKSRAASAVKKEKRPERIKNEDDFDAPVSVVAPKKRTARVKNSMKEEDVNNQNAVAKTSESSKVIEPVKRGRKRGVKREPSEDDSLAGGINSPVIPVGATKRGLPAHRIKGEVSHTVSSNGVPPVSDVKEEASQNTTSPAGGESLISGLQNDDLLTEYKSGIETGEITGDFDTFKEQTAAELAKSEPRKKGTRGKKSAAPSSRSTRASRSKNSS